LIQSNILLENYILHRGSCDAIVVSGNIKTSKHHEKGKDGLAQLREKIRLRWQGCSDLSVEPCHHNSLYSLACQAFRASSSAQYCSSGILFPVCARKYSGCCCVIRARAAAPCATTSDGIISVINLTTSVPTAFRAIVPSVATASVDASPVITIARTFSRLWCGRTLFVITSRTNSVTSCW
jgi:hypothetical protein